MARIKGLATVWGSEGQALYGPFLTVATDAASPHAGHRIGSIDNAHTADVEELRDSSGELIGAAVRNERMTLDIEFVPTGVRKADNTVDTTKNAIANAIQGLAFPGQNGATKAEGFTKVEISGVSNTGAAGGGADGTDDADVVGVNGDWIYSEGASRAWDAEGFTTVRMSLMRPLSSPITVTQLTTTIT